MLLLEADERPDWDVADMQQMLSHLLSSTASSVSLRIARGREGASLAQLIRDKVLGPEEYRQLKETVRPGRSSGLPEPVAQAAYFLVVGSALAAGQRVSRLDAGQVQGGLQWVLAQGWIAMDARGLAAEILRDLSE